MTSFNAASILMPLDEYYEHCVLPKPNIPKKYSGVVCNNQRQAGNLKSYKDNTGVDEDDGENGDIDEIKSSIHDSNMNQLDYETSEFNQLYDSIEEPPKAPVSNMVAESAQWRLQPINVNRPPGAAPLVPNNALHATSGLPPSSVHAGRENNNRRHYYRNRDNYNNYNSHNNVRNRLGYNPQQRVSQMPMDQRLGNTYNNFNNQQSEQNNRQQQNQFLMNAHLQNGRPQMNEVSINYHNNPNCNQFNHFGNQNNSNLQNFQITNSLTSLIGTANKISNNMHRAPMSHRLGAPVQNQQNNNGFGETYNMMQNLSPNNNDNHLMANSDSLRLVDLMNMDRNNCRNLNVSEVAKNAMLLLSSVGQKPILNELSELQKRSKLVKQEEGVNIDIKPEMTDVRMYHRFK